MVELITLFIVSLIGIKVFILDYGCKCKYKDTSSTECKYTPPIKKIDQRAPGYRPPGKL